MMFLINFNAGRRYILSFGPMMSQNVITIQHLAPFEEGINPVLSTTLYKAFTGETVSALQRIHRIFQFASIAPFAVQYFSRLDEGVNPPSFCKLLRWLQTNLERYVPKPFHIAEECSIPTGMSCLEKAEPIGTTGFYATVKIKRSEELKAVLKRVKRGLRLKVPGFQELLHVLDDSGRCLLERRRKSIQNAHLAVDRTPCSIFSDPVTAQRRSLWSDEWCWKPHPNQEDTNKGFCLFERH